MAAFTGKIRLLPDRLDQPLRWRKPRRVFVNSMSDLFHEDVPWEFIDRVFGAMLASKSRGHTFQILTKRPERMREYVTKIWPRTACGGDFATQYSHVWLGTSVEDQAAADLRLPPLLQTPAAVRWVSAEPLLGPVDFWAWLDRQGASPKCANCRRTKAPIGRSMPLAVSGSMCDRDCSSYLNDPQPDQLWPGEGAQEFGYTFEPFIDWLVLGGESGPHHRDLDLAWAHSIREQCRAAGVAYFGKQTSGPHSAIPLPDEGGLSDREYPR